MRDDLVFAWEIVEPSVAEAFEVVMTLGLSLLRCAFEI